MEFVKCQDKLSTASKKMYDDLREIVPVFSEDMVMYPYVQKVKEFLKG